MASKLPAKLQTPEISKFTQRANQIARVKPAIAYWCNYWIVNLILEKKLHTSDPECSQYTTDLMDRLEQTKETEADNDAIMDDTAGQAYVEQFALEVFQRADKTMAANKVTRQTADTFSAAATFLELLHIWGTPDNEIVSKIKYAKFHAVRIAKAIQAGEDPNATNPAPAPAQSEEALDLDSLSFPPNPPHQPSVEDDLEESSQQQSQFVPRVASGDSLRPSHQTQPYHNPQQSYSPALIPTPPSEAAPQEFYHPPAPGSDVSPLEPSPRESKQSAEAGYFPPVPQSPQEDIPSGSFTSGTRQNPSSPPPSTRPLASSHQNHPVSQPSMPSFPTQVSPNAPPPQNSQYRQQPPNMTTSVPPVFNAGVPHQYFPNQNQPPYSQPNVSQSPSRHPQTQPHNFPPPTQFYSQPDAPPGPENFTTDEEAILKAQKHAKWAISALNFEDVKTAIEELRVALEALGAR